MIGYLIWGVLVLGGLVWTQYRGLSLADVDEVKNVPKSVRDNPGAYRAHYSSYHRYIGGK
ncbi:MAG: hypothetical protein SFV54_01610 [Bryobacteraceae bacterium]|nr:hypothetical protein [Bryobacteraceae bacterium]